MPLGENPRLVSFRRAWVVAADGAAITSDSALPFREADEIEPGLRRNGYVVNQVREAPTRPGLEFVFITRLAD